MATYQRSSSKGSTVPPGRGGHSPSIVYDKGAGGVQRIGPGGGYTWGGGPRTFVGPSRPPQTRVEVGQEGDFVEGAHVWGPAEGDLGFPHATRWPGYPGGWEPPFFDTGQGRMGGPAWGGRFLGGSSLEGRVSTAFACMDLISRSLATMGLRVTVDNVAVPAPDWTDNPEPEIYTSMVDAMQALVNSLLMRGESFLVPTARYPDGLVARWVVLNPDQVDVEPSAGGLPLYSLGGMPLPRAEVCHIRYQVWAGNPRGVGPLEACWRNLISADALERWGTELAISNGIPTAILQSQMKLTKTQADALKLSWAEAAMSRGVLPAILSGGLTYTPLNLKPADVGLLDLRKFDETRIASCFGVPLWLVGLPMDQGLTYSTAQGAFDYFWRATLRPMAYNIACALSGWALPRAQYLRFASEQLVEPPVTERATTYETLIRAGVIDAAEARLLEHLPPQPVRTLEAASDTRSKGV